MRNLNLVLLSLFLSVVATFHSGNNAHAGDADELSAFKSAIRAKYDIKERAFATNDPELVLNEFYTADVISTGEGSQTFVGTEALRDLYNEVIVDTVRIASVYTHVDGDIGWDFANFFVTPADENTDPYAFKVLFLFERVDGEWFCNGDMYAMGEM